MNLADMIRPQVRDFEPYLPGKPIEEVRRELGLKIVVKLASNENALGTSPKAQRALAAAAAESFRYPEGPGTLLRRALAKKLGVSVQEIILGAGSDDIIEVLAKSFFMPEDEVIVSQHAFIRYKMAADLMGAKTIAVPMQDFKHDLRAMAEKIGSKTKAIFIANPNNPTGTYNTKSEVAEFINAYRAVADAQRPPFVIFDEAYYEFAREFAQDYPETLEDFRRGFNILVLRTFSKAYGLAGLRVGYGVARKEVVDVLDRVRPPFNVSSVAQAAALAALKDSAHVRKSAALAVQGMKYLTSELEKMKIPYVRSVGNFILIDVSPSKGKDVFHGLLKKGVVVRAMDEYGFPEHVRVSVGREQENKFFIRCFKEIL